MGRVVHVVSAKGSVEKPAGFFRVRLGALCPMQR